MDASTTTNVTATERYARVIASSKRINWDIDRDVIRGRRFDFTKPFMPRGLSLIGELPFLSAADQRLLSQVQGRTYSYVFGLVERFISAKVLDVSSQHSLGDQVALEALVRMGGEEIKHQELFRRLEALMAQDMPAGYVQTAPHNEVAKAVLGKSSWAVLALTLDIELMSQAHYRASIANSEGLSELWKDVFLFHWKEEAQHAILDEMELLREDARIDAAQRSAAVDDLIALVGAVDGIMQAQAKADVAYFVRSTATQFTPAQREQLDEKLLKAYRWQYIVSGAMEPRFQKVLFGLVDAAQAARIEAAMAPLGYAVPERPEMMLPMAA